MTTTDKNLKHRDLKYLSPKKWPCHECLIKVTCTKSFLDGTACDDYWEYVGDAVHYVRRREIEDKE